jgi:ATP-binding cassette, subfamily B, bacterial
MKFLWNHLKNHKKLLFLALFLAAINQFFSLLDPQIYRLIIDNYATKLGSFTMDEFLKGVGLLCLGLAGVAFVSRVAKNFQDYFVNVITQRIGTQMYANSVQHSLSLPYVVFEDQRSGELLQKLQKARTDTQALVMSLINIMFLSIVSIIFVVTYAFSVHWVIGLTYFLLIPLMATFAFFLSRKIKNAQKDIVRETAALAGSTTETIRNVELVKSLGLEEQEITRLNHTNDKILQLELKKIRIIRRLDFIQGTLVNAVRVVLIFIILYLIYTGKVSLGQFLTLFIYSFFIFSPMGEVAKTASSYQEAKASNEQLDAILSMKPEPKPKDGKKMDKIKDIDYKNVSFKYPSSNVNSINDISLNIKSGQTIAFAGPSGSGKSTMVKLLVGLYKPSKGSIKFNGTDLKGLDLDSLRQKVGLVSQETQLFAGTVRENLLFVNPKATDKECMTALRLASVTNILERGGKGLETRIGEGGIKISGGERQRLAIARALLRNPEIIIFDEATSSLDSITEKAITKTIKDVKRARPNSIVVLVAHRLSTIVHSDVIYVLEKGRIAEQGNHDQLIKEKGLYWAFWREQSGN